MKKIEFKIRYYIAFVIWGLGSGFLFGYITRIFYKNLNDTLFADFLIVFALIYGMNLMKINRFLKKSIRRI